MAPHRSQRLQKFFGCSCMNEDPGKDNKRKKRGKQVFSHSFRPSLEAANASSGKTQQEYQQQESTCSIKNSASYTTIVFSLIYGLYQINMKNFHNHMKWRNRT